MYKEQNAINSNQIKWLKSLLVISKVTSGRTLVSRSWCHVASLLAHHYNNTSLFRIYDLLVRILNCSHSAVSKNELNHLIITICASAFENLAHQRIEYICFDTEQHKEHKF
ncbi:Hypothetical_protein [Hexamita inflata]|uniref:Hypothetical_protein n=1 Tax=Hexamita inflata TaxID=28002 RepID=A0AA86PGM8_9EUKA|nr:Hypothetical protein HINF_LOCUS26599 [Hexamita inflata]